MRYSPYGVRGTISMVALAAVFCLLALAGIGTPLNAQQPSSVDDDVHVVQTSPPSAMPLPTAADTPSIAQSDEARDDARAQPSPAGSRVYFPTDINVEAAEAARARRIAHQQLAERSSPEDSAIASQVSRRDEEGTPFEQVSNADGIRALAQLTSVERQVLIDAVAGTDICERQPEIPAIRALCDGRIELRSTEFAQNEGYRPSAEERLLGEGLDGDRASDLESAIARLARNSPRADDFSNQIIASVGLANGAVGATNTAANSEDATEELSAETQALINAIVNQFGANGGGQ